ncbi:MAG: MFS transporter [Gemella morbillorum]|uniref:MFS transporter n=1 Tax=Gemella morbillorum TaxID=29391 RepID=A0AAP9KT39_9BACL|nr:MFS transporter [Gemella morbillorum]EFV34784.1 major facilitator superfamily transporter [Gemella morbillorum M424]MBF1209587.1 MFS transporter [Gemella morbillorum]QGS09100.1 MFS transporter [Gemella morbillorum]
MTKQTNKVIILLGIILLGMILRTPITSVGAIIGPLKNLLEINNTVAGLITTIPLIAFAIFSPFVAKISNKIGLEKTLYLAAIVTSIGLLLRFYINTSVFFVTTFIIGVGLTVGNVLLPGLAKKYFPENLGVMTGFYAVVMNVSASVAAGISYPILSSNVGGEKFSTGLAVNIWLIVSILNIVIYAIITKNSKSERIEDKKSGGKGYLRNLKMWSVMLSMGLQSALFYCSVSWFAEIMISKGFTPSEAGLLLSISQFAQFPSTFLVPVLAEKIKNKLIIPIFIAMGYVASLIGMIYIQGNFALMTIYIVLFALAGGGSFSYVMYLFSAKSKNEEEAADISGLAQAGGYWLAAIFPPLLGYVRDVLNWDVAIYILIMTASLLFITLLHSSSKGNIIEIK